MSFITKNWKTNSFYNQIFACDISRHRWRQKSKPCNAQKLFRFSLFFFQTEREQCSFRHRLANFWVVMYFRKKITTTKFSSFQTKLSRGVSSQSEVSGHARAYYGGSPVLVNQGCKYKFQAFKREEFSLLPKFLWQKFG